jgi:hypothetical protein
MKAKDQKLLEDAYTLIRESNIEEKFNYKPITSAKVDVWIEENDFGDSITRIDNIKIPKSQRNKGQGRTEVENIIKWAKENGSVEIVIESERRAISFWKKMGFVIYNQGGEVSTGILKLK